MDAAAGTSGYRADVQIQHIHRTGWFLNSPARLYRLLEAFPITMKVSSDLAGDSGDVAIASMTLSLEGLELSEL